MARKIKTLDELLISEVPGNKVIEVITNVGSNEIIIEEEEDDLLNSLVINKQEESFFVPIRPKKKKKRYLN